MQGIKGVFVFMAPPMALTIIRTCKGVNIRCLGL